MELLNPGLGWGGEELRGGLHSESQPGHGQPPEGEVDSPTPCRSGVLTSRSPQGRVRGSESEEFDRYKTVVS